MMEANKNIEIERLTNENNHLKSAATTDTTVHMMAMMDTAKVKEDEISDLHKKNEELSP